jgi:hypothetical protein
LFRSFAFVFIADRGLTGFHISTVFSCICCCVSVSTVAGVLFSTAGYASAVVVYAAKVTYFLA